MTKDDLGIIEVPPELRGLSDEEILNLNNNRGKTNRSSNRPSKKERLKKKLIKERERIKKIAEEYERKDFNPRHNTLMASKPMPKLSEFENSTEEKKTPLLKKKDEIFKTDLPSSTPSLEKKNIEVKPLLSSAPSPSSGRVLKGVFGFKGKESVKATIIKADDLLKTNALERAKKLKASKKTIPAVSETGEEPPKRPRGRPRKNPI